MAYNYNGFGQVEAGGPGLMHIKSASSWVGFRVAISLGGLDLGLFRPQTQFSVLKIPA